MATKYLSYDPATRQAKNVAADWWVVQTFTTEDWFLLTSVKLDVFNNTADSWRLYIYAVGESGTPVGSPLGGSEIVVTAQYWNEFTLTAGIPMHPATKYAICVHNLDSVMGYLAQDTVGGYAGGSNYDSQSMVNFEALAYDMHFELWGEELGLLPDFVASSVKIPVGSAITFTDDTIGGVEPYSYEWDFGDTETSQEENPEHTYAVPGIYTVTLTVTDNEATEVVKTKTNYIWI
jgi:hypothetical protein